MPKAVNSAMADMAQTTANTTTTFAMDGFRRMSSPAIVALVGYAVLVFIVLLPVDMFVYNDKTNQYTKQRYSFPYRLLVAGLLLFPFILSVYSVNCMMVGSCVAWSWIVAIITVIWAAMIAVVTFSTGSFSLDQMV
jgi:protein-S-isoprenylcysteine O-methyltransferase Ste14